MRSRSVGIFALASIIIALPMALPSQAPPSGTAVSGLIIGAAPVFEDGKPSGSVTLIPSFLRKPPSDCPKATQKVVSVVGGNYNFSICPIHVYPSTAQISFDMVGRKANGTVQSDRWFNVVASTSSSFYDQYGKPQVSWNFDGAVGNDQLNLPLHLIPPLPLLYLSVDEKQLARAGSPEDDKAPLITVTAGGSKKVPISIFSKVKDFKVALLSLAVNSIGGQTNGITATFLKTLSTQPPFDVEANTPRSSDESTLWLKADKSTIFQTIYNFDPQSRDATVGITSSYVAEQIPASFEKPDYSHLYVHLKAPVLLLLIFVLCGSAAGTFAEQQIASVAGSGHRSSWRSWVYGSLIALFVWIMCSMAGSHNSEFKVLGLSFSADQPLEMALLSFVVAGGRQAITRLKLDRT